MNSYQRLQAALDHRQPDRVCVDFGATFVSGIHSSCVVALREYFGLEKLANPDAEARGLPYVGVEIRQDLIGHAAGQAAWADRMERLMHSVAAGLFPQA